MCRLRSVSTAVLLFGKRPQRFFITSEVKCVQFFGNVVEKSLPANPLIADPLFWTGYVDKVGTGTEDIVTLCKGKGLKEPEYHQEEDFRVVIWRKGAAEDGRSVLSDVPSSVLSMSQVCTKLGVRREVVEPLLRMMSEPASAAELMVVAGQTNRTRFKKNYLDHLIGMGAVMMTDPDSPNSPQQRYVLTEAGRKVLEG